ncbi:MAG: M28 family metallopeptidase [Promethearchaeota archaeon]
MIDEKRIKQNLDTFSFPRLSGTDGERKVFEKAKEKINELNLHPIIQEFTFSTYFGRTYAKLAFSMGFVLLLILYLNIESILFFLATLIILVGFLYLFYIARHPEEIKFRNQLTSQNIFVKISPKDKQEEETDKNIFVMSHLDSKSQRFSILMRIRTIRIWVFSAIAAFFIIILKNYVISQFSLFLYIIGIIPLLINLLATILMNLNTTNNFSNGAIDDGSGIAVVLELLNYYMNSENHFNNYNLWFLFSGAEECGTMGIRHFYNNEIKDLDRNTSIPINFDAIGKTLYMFPNKKLAKTNGKFLNSFIKNSKELYVKKNPKKIYFGSHSDGYFLKKKDFIGIGFGDMESYKYIHSVNDTIDKVDPKLLAGLCKAITIALKDLDSNP